MALEEQTEGTIDITPNPRILQMLGEIAFEPWQCLAELVDNSIDAYLTSIDNDDKYLEKMGLGEYRINISLPNQQEFEQGVGKVTIFDTGPGMTLEEVNNSVRAGFTGNDPLGKLGLFGMGFNISTARLGRLTEIRTTRREDDNWLVVKLDLDLMQETRKFSARFSREKKNPDDEGAHGTIVEVHKLKKVFRGNLTSGAGRSSIRRQLSRIYSGLLSTHPISMKLGDNEISPRKHCHWDSSRTAIVGSGVEVPCYIPIDHALPDNYFCNVCWHWSDQMSVTNDECPLCTSPVVLKTRRIHGWVGIQRYFDQEHYGIDFIRNGRVIEELNKDCFYWNNESGEQELEYPIDATHWGGRIIGQIRIDFAQVDYQKTKFEKNQVWAEVIDALRGPSPFRPKKAAELQYPENTSPIGRLYKTFRGARPVGRRTLVPGKRGDERSGDNAESKKWAEQFYKGVSEYQTDNLWWERVEAAERYLRGQDEDPPHPPGPIEDPFPPGPIEDPHPPGPGEPGEPEYLRIVPELSLSYEFPDASVQVAPIGITVYEDTRSLRPRDLQNVTPLQIDTRQAPHRYTITYHAKHPAFNQFAETVDDYILIELSHWFSVRHGEGEWPSTRVYQALKNAHQEGRKLDLLTLGREAGALLLELKEHLATCNISRTREDADPDLLRELEEEVMSTTGNIGRVDELLQDGTWIESVSDKYLTEVLGGDPTMVMDGRFFLTSYSTIVDNEDLRADTFDRIIGCLKDAIMIKKTSERMTVPDKQLLLRANAALSYLNSQRAS